LTATERNEFSNSKPTATRKRTELEAGDVEDTRELARKIGLGFGAKIRWEKIGNRPAEDVNGIKQEEDGI
jgi:hypothetical protein